LFPHLSRAFVFQEVFQKVDAVEFPAHTRATIVMPELDKKSLSAQNIRLDATSAKSSPHDFMASPASHPRDPLHGITLENILNQLVQKHGWSEMGRRIPVRCFQFNPSVKSSLTFLRKTPWARKKVEDWFIGELPLK
jgi:hypothetical protein